MSNIDNLPVSRRRLLGMTAGVCLASGFWPGALAAQDASAGEFPFICVNDLHYTDENCAPFFKRMVEKMKQASPDSKLLLVAGDLVENGTVVQCAAIKELLAASGMTLKVVIGNHDYASDTDRKAFEEAFPDSLNYTFEHGGWQFVCVDTTFGRNGLEIQKPALQWLDDELPKLDKKRPMILMGHHPLAAGVAIRVRSADAMLDRFKEFNLRAAFNAHYHAFTEKTLRDCVLTTDRCCSFRANNHDGSKEKGFFACQVKDGKVVRQFVEVPLS
jgi:hypothetical protein